MTSATLFCPSCGDEYVAGSQACSDCRVALVPERPEVAHRSEPSRPGGIPNGYVELGEWPPLAAVTLVRRLTDAGVDVSVQWSTPGANLSGLAVPDGQLEFADAVLRELPIEDDLPQGTPQAYLDRVEARLAEIAVLLDEMRQLGDDDFAAGSPPY